MGLLTKWIEGYSFGKGSFKGAKVALTAVAAFLATHVWAQDLVASVAEQLRAQGFDVSAGTIEGVIAACIAGVVGFILNLIKTQSKVGRLLLALPFLVALSTPVRADDDVLFRYKALTANWPLAKVEASYLYDFVGKESLVGIETPILFSWKARLTVGGVKSLDVSGISPYAGVDWETPPALMQESIKIGAWFGFDFEQKERRGGLKASVNLWK